MQPPIFTPYQPPAQPPAPMRVRIDGLTDAWNIVKTDYSPFIIAIVLMILALLAVTLPLQFAFAMSAPQNSFSVPNPFSNFRTFALLAGPTFVATFLQVYLATASQRIALLRLRGFGTTMADLTNFSGRGGPISAWAFLLALLSTCFSLAAAAIQSSIGFAVFSPGYIGAQVCSGLVGIILGTITLFVPLMIVDQGKSPLEALLASISATGRIFFPALGMYLLVNIAGVLGVIACCVGVLFTLPIALAWPAVLYNDFYRPQVSATLKENEFYPRPQF